MTNDSKPEDLGNNVPQTNATDGDDELFCGPQKQDNDCVMSGGTQDDRPSSMDCASAGGIDFADVRSNPAPTLNSSPGPDPVEPTCVTVQSPNPTLTCCFTNSPSRGVGMSSDMEMLSPDSPVCKMPSDNNSADRDSDCCACTESNSMKALDGEPQHVGKEADSQILADDKVHKVLMEAEDAEIAKCSGSSVMSQDVISGQSEAPSQRYCQSLSVSNHPFISFISFQYLLIILVLF